MLPCALCAKPRKRSKGSMSSMRSEGWGFRKVSAALPYFLFLISYSLFPCVFAPLRPLRETKKTFKRFNEFNAFKRLEASCIKKLRAFEPSCLRVKILRAKKNAVSISSS
jgi:hypothetical protein